MFMLPAFVVIIEAQNLSPKIQQTYDACVQIREAIGSVPELKIANERLKECETQPFTSLRITGDDYPTLDNHLVFDYEFIDSLIVNRKVYKFAQQYAERSLKRGKSNIAVDVVYTRTCTVKGNSSVKLLYVDRGHQEIAVVTEPQGKVTLRINDKTHNKWYNDNVDETIGRESRFQIFDLPTSERSTIEIEVINLHDKDISFVVICGN